MLSMDKKLEQREKEGKIIKCGIVGADQVGCGMATQIVLMKGIIPIVVPDVDLELAVCASKYAGVKDADAVRTNEIAEADKAMDKGKYVVTTNSNLIPQCCPVEVAIDATEVSDVEAKVVTNAVNNKEHVVTLNVEMDVVIGPLFDKTVKNNGAIHTGSVGDEPDTVTELYDFATVMDLGVKAMGKGKNNRTDRNCNPDTVLEEATGRKMSSKMLYAFKDGTETMVGMTAMSDATGLVPDVIGEHSITSGVKSLNETYKLKEDGGILKWHSVVEYANGIASGAFVAVAADNGETAYQIQYHSMGSGPLWTLYRPYRLCNLEAPLTAAKVVIDGEPTTVPKNGLVSECITAAKIDLKTRQTINGIGGYTTYGSICKHEEVEEKGYASYGLVNHRAVMRRDVKKGGLIIYDGIELNIVALTYKLRQE